MAMQFQWRSLLQQPQHWSKHAQVVVSSYHSCSPTHDCYESEGLMTQTCNWTHIGVLGSTSCIHLFFVQSSIHAHLRQKTTPTFSVSKCKHIILHPVSGLKTTQKLMCCCTKVATHSHAHELELALTVPWSRLMISDCSSLRFIVSATLRPNSSSRCFSSASKPCCKIEFTDQ